MSSLKHILNIIKFSGSYKKSCRSCNFQDFEWSQFIFLQLADVAAFDGKFSDAAKLYKKVGQEQKALSMYTDLRMFDLVRNYDNLCVWVCMCRCVCVCEGVVWVCVLEREGDREYNLYKKVGQEQKAL